MTAPSNVHAHDTSMYKCDVCDGCSAPPNVALALIWALIASGLKFSDDMRSAARERPRGGLHMNPCSQTLSASWAAALLSGTYCCSSLPRPARNSEPSGSISRCAVCCRPLGRALCAVAVPL
jgi:hypothetical protein